MQLWRIMSTAKFGVHNIAFRPLRHSFTPYGKWPGDLFESHVGRDRGKQTFSSRMGSESRPVANFTNLHFRCSELPPLEIKVHPPFQFSLMIAANEVLISTKIECIENNINTLVQRMHFL